MRFNMLTSSFVLLAACGGGSGGPDVDYASQLVQGSWTCPSSSPFGSAFVLTASGKNLRAQWLPELIMTPSGAYAGDWPPDDGGGGDDSGPAGGDWSGVVTMTLERSSLTPEAQAHCTVDAVQNDDVSLQITPQDRDLEANTLVTVDLSASETEYCPIDWQGLCELAP